MRAWIGNIRDGMSAQQLACKIWYLEAWSHAIKTWEDFEICKVFLLTSVYLACHFQIYLTAMANHGDTIIVMDTEKGELGFMTPKPEEKQDLEEIELA